MAHSWEWLCELGNLSFKTAILSNQFNCCNKYEVVQSSGLSYLILNDMTSIGLFIWANEGDEKKTFAVRQSIGFFHVCGFIY